MIIPTYNAVHLMGPTLGSLAEGLEVGAIRELIIADGGSDDEIEDVAEGVGAVLVTSDKGRGVQLSAGCGRAKGPWLLIIHADTRLPAGWADAVRRHIETAPDKAAAFRLSFDDHGLAARWTAGWANIRTRLFGLPYGDQGLLISQGLYQKSGGYPGVPLMEDVAIARRIGWRRLRLLPLSVTTGAERYRRDGWFRRGARNLCCLFLFLSGVSADRIARLYG